MEKKQDEMEIDLLEILFVLKGRLIYLILAAAAGGILAGIITVALITPLYSSTSELYILSSSTSITSLTDIQVGTSLTKDYVQLAQSRPVVDQVIENLNLNRTYEEVLEQVEFTNPTDTRILEITATDADPELAKDLVDEFATVSQERMSAIMKTDEPSIVQYGYVAEKPISPNFKKNAAVGILLGLLLAVIVVIAAYMLDDSVKSPDDIEKYLGLNTLTSIPRKEAEETAQKNGKISDRIRKGLNGNGK